TVKRLSADDSVQLACESRTSSGSPIQKPKPRHPRGFVLYKHTTIQPTPHTINSTALNGIPIPIIGHQNT
ncbi:MAG: hypothetical protein ACK4FF_12065, partial [Limnobacter sp.]|uniref:hypothetical protein n=1 Tax=Limnobacter sp. TaxID=2003368 RepID=UPI00391A8D6D